MNRKLLNGLLVLTVAAGGVFTFTSCKDDDFRMNTELTEMSLQAQIDAIRAMDDPTFDLNLEDWLNNWTNELTKGGFKDYEEMLAAAQAMNLVYQAIQYYDPEKGLPDEVAKYVSNLYDWIFENKIKQSDWYKLIYDEDGELTDLSEIVRQLKELKDQLNDINGRASSVEVSAVHNPVFGSVNLPLDVKSTILATYIYEGKEYDFPADMSSHVNTSSPSQATSELIRVIDALVGNNNFHLVNGQFTDNGSVGNMGASLLTINPSGNDYTNASKYTVELVNSKNEVALSSANPLVNGVAELSLGEYDDVLYFGSSRAEAPGVYALNVNATKANYNQFTVDLDKTSLKDAVKELIDSKSISSMAHLGETVFNSVNNKLPAYAVKVSWKENVVTDDNGKETFEINSVYSGFDIAAAVLHPLSYGTDLGAVIPSDKKIPVVHNSIVEYLEKVQNRLHFDINIPELGNDIEIDFNVVVKDGYVYFQVYDENGNLVDAEPIKINYNGQGIQASDADLTALVDAILEAQSMELSSGLKYKMIKELNENLASVNKQILDVENRVNNWFERIKNNSKLDYAQKLLDLYNKLAQKANHILADPNHYLQIAMAYSFGSGAHFMSNDIFMPLTVYKKDGGQLDVITTSYTGDIVTPSYKKYVAITGAKSVYNRSFNYDTENVAKYNTGDLNKVYSGQEDKIQIDLSKLDSDMSYRITYVSVDYRGQCSMENYYLTVMD